MKISTLPESEEPVLENKVMVVDGTETKLAPLQMVKDYLSDSSSSSVNVEPNIDHGVS